MLKNEALAEEVVQDSFVKIWKNINSYKDQKSRLFTWMINILRNSAIDKIRSRDFKFTEKSDSIEHFVSIINQQDFTELKVDALGIKDVLKGLPEAQREVIDWIYFGGYTQSEVAKEYGIPLGTVKTRLRSALVVLRKILKVN